MSENERARRALLDRSQWDALDHWRADSDRRAEERARARRERKQQKCEVATVANRSEFEGRLATLEAQLADLNRTVSDAFHAIADAFNTLGSQRMELSAEQREEIRQLKVEVAKLGSTMNYLLGRDFKFSREKSDGGVIDLPNPLIRRTTVN